MHRSILLALLLSPIGAAFADGLYSDLLQAAGTGDVAQVQALLAQGSDPNLPSGVVGRSALAYAVFFKQVETITVLLEAGADVNVRSDFGHTPLHEALSAPGERGKLAIVKLLLAHGADVNAEDKLGMTPLKLTELDELDAIAEVLRQRGAR